MNSVLLVGVGGYGGLNAKEVLENMNAHNSFVAGIVEPFIENSPIKDRIGNIPVYKTLEEFYEKHTADLAVISTPIHLHAEQCIFAMSRGSDVLCEKPIAPTIQQAQEMDAAAKKYNRHLNIGFQLCYAEPMLELKRNFKRFGKLKGIDVLVSWPRNSAYFARPWAAKREMNGKVILDSIMMNACAHYFENPLFLLGDEPDKAAMPERIRGKLIRANNIEMFDTAIIEAEVISVPFRYAVTHCGEENINPLTKFTFEDSAVFITIGEGDDAMFVEYTDGTRENLGSSYKHPFEKIWFALDVFNGKKQPVCTVKTALPHLVCVDAVSEKLNIETETDFIEKDGVRIINGLLEKFKRAYENSSLDEFELSDWIDLCPYREYIK